MDLSNVGFELEHNIGCNLFKGRNTAVCYPSYSPPDPVTGAPFFRTEEELTRKKVVLASGEKD